MRARDPPVRADSLGVEFPRLDIELVPLVEPEQLPRHLAQVVAGRDELGIDPDGLPVLRGRPIEVARRVVHVPQVVPGGGRARSPRGRVRFVIPDGVRQPAFPLRHEAARQKERRVRPDPVGPREVRGRLGRHQPVPDLAQHFHGGRRAPEDEDSESVESQRHHRQKQDEKPHDNLLLARQEDPHPERRNDDRPGDSEPENDGEDDHAPRHGREDDAGDLPADRLRQRVPDQGSRPHQQDQAPQKERDEQGRDGEEDEVPRLVERPPEILRHGPDAARQLV